jgi:hypothetical protein
MSYKGFLGYKVIACCFIYFVFVLHNVALGGCKQESSNPSLDCCYVDLLSTGSPGTTRYRSELSNIQF